MTRGEQYYGNCLGMWSWYWHLHSRSILWMGPHFTFKDPEMGGELGEKNPKFFADSPILDEWSPRAKWARNGRIVKLPQEEQANKPNYRCASPKCPGHSLPPPEVIKQKGLP